MHSGINNKISAGYAYYLTLTIEEWIDVFSRPYIHNNPVKSELVANPEDYLYSSLHDYSGEKGCLKLYWCNH